MQLSDKVQYLKGVGQTRAKQLAKLSIFTLEDLLRNYPRDYIDYTNPYPIAQAPYQTPCVVKAEIYGRQQPVRISNGRTLCRVTAGDESAGLQIAFFNNPWAAEKLQLGKEYLFYGRLSGAPFRREMTAPVFLPADSTAPLTPVYHQTEGIHSAYLAKLCSQALKQLAGQILDPVPAELCEQYRLPRLEEAFQMIHCPHNTQQIAQAKRRFVFEELFYLQLGMKLLHCQGLRANRAKLTNIDLAPFWNNLHFAPTGAQRRAVQEILQDMSGEQPMNRLLQGDVGSGKTLVAAAAIYAAAKNGLQSVLMAPTEILATQHAKTLADLLEPLGIRVALLTGSVKGNPKKQLLKAIAAGQAQLVVGTHAVLSDQVQFARLGLAVTDEQHRFGVRQRGLLAAKAQDPHLLVMSATPIPRTLNLLVFGELDVSILDQLPPGRTPVKTYAVTTQLRGRMFAFLDRQIDAGHQVFIVCPLIEAAEEENSILQEMQSVTKYYDQVAKKLLPKRRIGLMHGRMKSAEKAEVMRQFSNHELDVLCSTTVIEVGVDVPNANVMVIENAERYGLSALHQLRGRVGRGSGESFCILVSDHDTEEVRQRLSLLCHTNDGFEIARYDLEHRGPGDFFGARQHGLPTLKVANAMTDTRALETAARDAATLLETDPTLHDHPLLLAQVEKLFCLAGGFSIN